MTDHAPLTLPDAFCYGPSKSVDLGVVLVDFWLEDNDKKKFKELKSIQVSGIQLLQPKDRIHIKVTGISPNDALGSFFDDKAFIQIGKGTPIECVNVDVNDSESTWLPLQEPLDIPHSEQNGCEVCFLLFGFPLFYGEHDVRTQDQDGRFKRYGQIYIEVDNWTILISAHNQTSDFANGLRDDAGLLVSHVGKIRKKGVSNNNISWNETHQIITCLHHFLSFAIGRWQALGSVRLLNQNDVCVHEMWGLLRGGEQLTQNSIGWWCPRSKAHLLADAFSGFWTLWNDPLWNNSLREIIYWYLQANISYKGHLGCDSALILSQSTLEKLAWLYVTQVRKAVSEKAFQAGKLQASNQIRLLAKLADLPHKIPDTIQSLKPDAKGQAFEDAFHAITSIRNQLVHSRKKQEFKDGAEFDALNLSQWYVEMCLLRFMRYQGEYVNRLKMDKWVGETESVPWASTQKCKEVVRAVEKDGLSE